MMRADFLRREERRRFLRSLLMAAGIYAAAAVIAVVGGFAKGRDLADVPSTMWIDLSDVPTGGVSATAGREGPKVEALAPVAPPTPTRTTIPRAPAPPTPKVTTPKAAAPKALTPVPKTDTQSKPAAVSTPVPTTPSSNPAPGTTTGDTRAATSEPAAVAAAGPPALPVETWVPGPRPAGSRVLGSESGSGVGQVTAASAANAMSTVVSGSEKGNSLETVLGARAGKAGRSLYVPIYLYMPLPRSIDASVAGKVPAEHRENFFRFYSRSGETWALSRDVPVAERDDLWMSLEEGGYDFSKADYLDGGRLKPLTLSFVVTQAVGRTQPRLEAVNVTSSSGDPQVDEAVVYGFRRASFFNATDGTISGTFTYRFSK